MKRYYEKVNDDQQWLLNCICGPAISREFIQIENGLLFWCEIFRNFDTQRFECIKVGSDSLECGWSAS